MRNKYEFRIEDIHTVSVLAKSSDTKYSQVYIRETKDGKLTTSFIQQYRALPEELEDGKISAICIRCESYNTFDKDEFNKESFIYKCAYCDNDYKDIIDENALIEILRLLMNKDTFFDLEIYINGIRIE